MSIRGTIVMLVLCLAVGGFWFFHDYKGQAERDQAQANEEKIIALGDVNEVCKVLWESPSFPDEKRVLEFKDGLWMLSDGGKESFIAAQRTIDDVLRQVSELKRLSVINENPQDSELAQYGLDKPAHHMQLFCKGSQQASAEIFVGSKVPTGDAYYMRSNKSPAVLEVSGDFMEVFGSNFVDLRETSALVFSAVKVNKLSVHQPGQADITVSKLDKSHDVVDESQQGDDHYDWLMNAPQEGKADANAINDYLWNIDSIKVERFMHPDEAGKVGKPLVSWDITGDSGRTIKVDLCDQLQGVKTSADDKAKRFYMVRHNPDEYFVGTFDGELTSLTSLKANDFLDHHVLDMKLDDIQRVEINIPATAEPSAPLEILNLDARKTRDGWNVLKPEKTVRNRDRVNNAVTEIAYTFVDLLWEEKLEHGGSKLEAKRPVATLYGEQDKVLAHLYVGEKSSDGLGYYLKVEGREEVYVVKADPSQSWLKSLKDMTQEEDEQAKPSPAPAGKVPGAAGDVKAPAKAGHADGEAPLEMVPEPSPASNGEQAATPASAPNDAKSAEPAS